MVVSASNAHDGITTPERPSPGHAFFDSGETLERMFCQLSAEEEALLLRPD